MCADSGPREEPVVLAPHDPTWSSKFDAEKGVVTDALGAAALEVHHIGSTAVPGLAAKPVIDILVAVDSLEDPAFLIEALSRAGYQNVAHDDDIHRLFFLKGTPREYHVHVVKLNSWTYWKHLMFRDILVSNPEVRAEYGRLKSELAARFRDDRRAYTDAKGQFVERTVVERARGR